MIKSTKYNFYDDNGKKCIIVNDDFEEEKEVKDLFDSEWSSSSTNPNFKMESYNDTFHFKPISMDASTVNMDASPVKSTDENDIIVKDDFEVDDKELNDIFISNSVSTSNNPNFETGYYNVAFHFTPTPSVTSLDTPTDGNVNENTFNSSQRKNVFKKIKSFFKKVVTHKRNGFS
ncbi:hypothetical protein TNCT_473541 [Trichonephila clavata]|uniref:Uncharacterized protein n=1 Tax=Trichonephila clavata TaxID=2740835 RepID=A0A8X6IMI0_TRICU|nr:hypothetical protein TNCT_473541 [Trichonephila clavata]